MSTPPKVRRGRGAEPVFKPKYMYWERAMGKTQVVSVRLDSEIVEELKKRGDISSFLRELITKSVAKSAETSLPQIEEVLSQFRSLVKEYVERVKQFCEEHAKEITESHESEKDKFKYWRDLCLYRYRVITRHNLSTYISDKLLPRLQRLDPNQRTTLEKRLNEIVEEAVNEIYRSQYPPAYPL